MRSIRVTRDVDITETMADPDFDPEQVVGVTLDCTDVSYVEDNERGRASLHMEDDAVYDFYVDFVAPMSHEDLGPKVLQALLAKQRDGKMLRVTIEVVDA